MTNTPLTDFLILLATNEEKLREFNSDTGRALSLMTLAGLSDAQRQAVLSRDPTAIHRELFEEGTSGEFVVPGGPIIQQAGRFSVTPIGIIIFEEGARQPSRPTGATKVPPARGKPGKAIKKPTKKAKSAKAAKASRTSGTKSRTSRKK